MKLKVFCWYDKVDKVYMRDSILADRSTRSVCRGYLHAFEQDKKMNFKEFELHQIGVFDDESGFFESCNEVIDPTIVYEKPSPEKEGVETDI
jgi:hypothetical protein